jgi:hypothetical protein
MKEPGVSFAAWEEGPQVTLATCAMCLYQRFGRHYRLFIHLLNDFYFISRSAFSRSFPLLLYHSTTCSLGLSLEARVWYSTL